MKTQADGKQQLEQCQPARQLRPQRGKRPRGTAVATSGGQAANTTGTSSNPQSCNEPLRMETAKLAGKKIKSNFIF